MAKVAIVTDVLLTSPRTEQDLPILSFPLMLLWDNQSLKDLEEITTDAFYERLKTSSTSLPHFSTFALGISRKISIRAKQGI